jgi:hypothetical protein
METTCSRVVSNEQTANSSFFDHDVFYLNHLWLKFFDWIKIFRDFIQKVKQNGICVHISPKKHKVYRKTILPVSIGQLQRKI